MKNSKLANVVFYVGLLMLTASIVQVVVNIVNSPEFKEAMNLSLGS